MISIVSDHNQAHLTQRPARCVDVLKQQEFIISAREDLSAVGHIINLKADEVPMWGGPGKIHPVFGQKKLKQARIEKPVQSQLY